MKKLKPTKLQLTRITVTTQASGGYGYYRSYGSGCGISYAAYCSQSCNTCNENCGTAQYSECNGLHCL